jgi:hypothetical protein
LVCAKSFFRPDIQSVSQFYPFNFFLCIKINGAALQASGFIAGIAGVEQIVDEAE